jgi:hypothetical protein
MRNYATKVYDYIDKKTGARIVKATTMYAGKTVSAVAKCDPDDNFYLKFGTDVALLRLDYKIALKRAASMDRRAAMYEAAIKDAYNCIKHMQKEQRNARICATDRRVEAKDIEFKLKDKLGTI